MNDSTPKTMPGARTWWAIRQDVIRAKFMNSAFQKNFYDGKLYDIVRAKTKKELSVYMLDDNPNVRAAAKIIATELDERALDE